MARLSVLFRHRRQRVTGAGELDFFLYRHLEKPAGWVTDPPLLMGKSTRTVVMFNSFFLCMFTSLPTPKKKSGVYQELAMTFRKPPIHGFQGTAWMWVHEQLIFWSIGMHPPQLHWHAAYGFIIEEPTIIMMMIMIIIITIIINTVYVHCIYIYMYNCIFYYMYFHLSTFGGKPQVLTNGPINGAWAAVYRLFSWQRTWAIGAMWGTPVTFVGF